MKIKLPKLARKLGENKRHPKQVQAKVEVPMEIKLPTFECHRCGHKWHPKKETKPRCCGFCKSPYWDTPCEKESACKTKHVQLCGSCTTPREA